MNLEPENRHRGTKTVEKDEQTTSRLDPLCFLGFSVTSVASFEEIIMVKRFLVIVSVALALATLTWAQNTNTNSGSPSTRTRTVAPKPSPTPKAVTKSADSEAGPAAKKPKSTQAAGQVAP